MAILTARNRPDVGAAIRSAREARGLSRERLAAQLGVSVSMLVRLEREGRMPHVTYLMGIADALDLSLDDVLRQEASA